MSKKNPIKKYSLANGLTILVRPIHTIPKVSIQIWYNVGSKDEKTSERGLAHLLEHMVFKGTEKLSESDINLITHKLSGSTNAFTTYDYTGYLFDFPKQNWQMALELLADCMRNCTFKQDLLNAEMKSVIQELKMYRDDYEETLLETLMETIFSDHPYHHPIIGYKQDLWHITRKGLLNFYHKHYVPNNATLVIVGDVEPEEVYKAAEKYFGSIPTAVDYKKDKYFWNKDIIAKTTKIYRDVTQPEVMVGWVVPGIRKKQGFLFDMLAWLIGNGKGSRLYKQLVNELQFVSDIETFTYDLFDYSLFVIQFQPFHASNIESIITVINNEIEKLTQHIPEKELHRAEKKAEVAHLDEFITTEKQAFIIGELFLGTNDLEYPFNYIQKPEQLEKKLRELIQQYLRPNIMHQAMILPIPDQEKEKWRALQKEADTLDAQVLAKKVRECSIEDGVYAAKVEAKKPKIFISPKYKKITLDNGLEVLYHNTKRPGVVELILDYKGSHLYDPKDLLGLSNFVSQMLTEGTKNYSASELADVLEGYGMDIDTKPGRIILGVLPEDLEKGLELLTEIVENTTFEKDAIGKVREQIIYEINDYWDVPKEFINQLARTAAYKDHQYGNPSLGTKDGIAKISQDDLINFFETKVSPQGARLAIVGDLQGYNLAEILKKTIGFWSGPEVLDVEYPILQRIKKEEITYPINRDQTVLGYVGLSVDRMNPNFDKLLLFDQILTGGFLGSMSAKLFQLREQTGLFYTIGGSLILGSSKQPGMIFIKTIVTQDDLEKAERLIEQTIDYAADTITQQEFQDAKNAIENSIMDLFETNKQMANTFLFLERFGLPQDYFDKRAAAFQKIAIPDVQQAVKNYLRNDKLIKIKVGRV